MPFSRRRGGSQEMMRLTPLVGLLNAYKNDAGGVGWYWPQDEGSGAPNADNALYRAALGLELLVNPGNPCTFTADNPDGWTIANETPTDYEISEVGVGEGHGGAGTDYLNFYALTATPILSLNQTILTVGDTYSL